MPITCSVGIMAYNEEGNIGPLLEALTSQRLKSVSITEIVVVASGCTDNTEAIVREWTMLDSRICLLVQEKRSGKAVAINEYLPPAKEKSLGLFRACFLPQLDALGRLVAPLADPEGGVA